MYIDAQNQFSDAQAITADAASTNIVDMGAVANQGAGEALIVSINLTEAFNTLTSLTFQLQCDNDVAFGSARTLTQLTVALAELTLGAQFSLPVPLERVERYLRLNYDVTGTNPTTGKVDAWLTTPNMVSRPFANG